MQSFEYVAPTSVDDVLDYLAQADDCLLMGGGTAATLLMKQDLLAPDLVVGLGRVRDLSGIAVDDGMLRIGATCTLAQIEASPEVADRHPMLAHTAHAIGNVRVRHVATAAGNLVHADPAQDLAPALMVLGASVVLMRRGGTRVVPVESFFTDYMKTCVTAGELVTEIRVPNASGDRHAVYVKFRPRSQDDYATVGVACSLAVSDGRCTAAAVALGGVDAVPLRIPTAEAVLNGRGLTRERVSEAAREVVSAISPWDDGRGTEVYKREMSRVWTERALLNLCEEAGIQL